MSWEISIDEWAGWIEEDSVQSPVWLALDEFDEEIRDMLESAPFDRNRGGSPATPRRTTLRPGEQSASAGEPAASDSFESRPTIVRTTVDGPAEPIAKEPSRLEVALASGGGPGLEVELVAAPAGGAPQWADSPVRTGSTWPPGAVPPPPAEQPPPAEESSLYIPTLTRQGGETVPVQAPLAPIDAVPPPTVGDAVAPGKTLVVAPPQPPASANDEEEPPSASSSQTSGVIVLSPEEAESLRIVDREEAPPQAPRSKIVIAAGAVPELVDREDSDADEIDADELEEQEEQGEHARPAAPPPTPRAALVAHPPPPPSLPHEPPGPPRPRIPVFARPSDDEDVGPDWVENVFGEDFPAMGRQGGPQATASEVDFFLELVRLQVGAAVLDVGCGDGAHALALASRGFRVTGVDRSSPLIERARVASEMVGAKASFVHGDIRTAPVEGPFDAALCVGSMLGYRNLATDREILGRIRKLLGPEARLLLHVFNRDHVVSRLPARSWWQGQGCLVLDEVTMDHVRNRVQVHRTAVFEDGKQFEHRYSILGYSLHDLIHLCDECGLDTIEISGSRYSRGRFFGATSPDIWLLLRPIPD